MAKNVVLQSPLYQTPDEQLAYSVTTTPWGSTPSSVAVKAYDEDDGSDVTSVVFPTNSPSVSGDVITLSLLRALTVSHSYRIDVKFTDSDSNIWELFFIVRCIER
jgi:hypothetical protein